MLVRIRSNRNSHSLVVGMQNGTVNLEDSLEVSNKTNMLLVYNPAISLLVIYPITLLVISTQS